MHGSLTVAFGEKLLAISFSLGAGGTFFVFLVLAAMEFFVSWDFS